MHTHNLRTVYYRQIHQQLLLLTLLGISGCISTRPTETRSLPPILAPLSVASNKAYIGLILRDDPKIAKGTLISWILSGPLHGLGPTAPTLSRGDILLRANGINMTADRFTALIKKSHPGDILTLEVKRTGGNPNSALPTPGKKSEIKILRVPLGKRSEWTGPVKMTATKKTKIHPIAVPHPTQLETFLHHALQQKKLEQPIEKLIDLFHKTQKKNNGYNALSRVSDIFHHPMQMPERVLAITNPLTRLGRDPLLIFQQAAANLDAATPQLGKPIDLSNPGSAVIQVAQQLQKADNQLQQALNRIDAPTQAAIPLSLNAYQKAFNQKTPDQKTFIRCLRASMLVDYDQLLAASAQLSGLMTKSKRPAANLPAVRLPSPLKHKVKGTILAAIHLNGYWVVFGGPGPNEYDMTTIDAVIDAGGKDRYLYPGARRPRTQVIVDMAGNDQYLGEENGPASATLGLSLLVDYAGNDEYNGKLRSCGSALMGVALLLDYNGNDTYRGSCWSLGAGFYGTGAILDLGSGNDIYSANFASEGIGGPRGFGLIYENSGQDLYRANGPVASAYGVAASYYGASQGVGFGVRGYDTGGIGVILDRSGSDRYEAGEFSQGGGYYWGLGIIDDRNGNDLYYGNRYSQGFGCHQALGALVDHAGDDTYWSMTAANQGGAWDIGMGLLLDKKGNDAYRADSLAQGGAAMQGIAWLIDTAGTDHYVARRGGTQGKSRGNSYHFAKTNCQSWSLLLDTGGKQDFYSSGRSNGKTLTTGSLNKKHPRDSHLYGLFIDAASNKNFGW